LQNNYQLMSQRWESNPQPPHYECGALPIEATLASFILTTSYVVFRLAAGKNETTNLPPYIDTRKSYIKGLVLITGQQNHPAAGFAMENIILFQ
jgi:hypothetical protein